MDNNSNIIVLGEAREREILRMMDKSKLKITPPRPSTTRSWTFEAIILQWLSKFRRNIEKLLRTAACATYITRIIRNIINDREY